MRGTLIRLIIAVIVVLVLFWLLPPLLRVLGLPTPGGDAAMLLHAAVGLLALIYIFWGPTPSTPWG